MKKLIFIFLINFSCFLLLNGQTNYINAIYNPNNSLITGRGILIKDSSVYVLASMFDSTNLIKNAYFKFNNNGFMQNFKSIGIENHNFFAGYSGCFGKTSDGNFYTVGAVQDSIAYPTLIKINTNFDIVFFKSFNDTIFADASFQQGKVTYDKGFILVGTKPGPGAYDMDILVIKADSMGNEQWHKFISLGSSNEFARNVIQTPDKGYLLGCYSYDNQISLSGDGIIIKLDSLGNTKWLKTIGGPNQDGVPVVALAKDSNYIVATSYAYYTEFLGFSDLKLQVLKLSRNNGNIIWNKQFDTIRTAYYPVVAKINENGSIIIFGTLFMNNGNVNFQRSFVFKISTNGDSLFNSQYWNDSTQGSMNQIVDFQEDEQKNIYACGEVYGHYIPQSLWLVKMDSMGCLQPNCNPVEIKEMNTQRGQFQIFPNPATTHTTITYQTAEKALTLQIYNMLGQKVYEEKLAKGSSQTTINITGFKPGLYKVVVGESSGMLLIQ